MDTAEHPDWQDEKDVATQPTVEDDYDDASLPIDCVQLDGLVLLKIIKHCKESVPEVVTGQLLGLPVSGTLEVTSCFPFPSSSEDTDAYQFDMMKCLRHVNVDNNTVGWYQSAWMGQFLHSQLLETQYNHQKAIPNSVVVVYDPFRTTAGRLVLQAFRLSDEFMAINTGKKFGADKYTGADLVSMGILEEVPIKVHNSHLVHAFLYELREHKSLSCDHERLSLGANTFLEKGLDDMSSLIDEFNQEQSEYMYFHRRLSRQRAQQQTLMSKWNNDNEARKAAGKPTVSLEEMTSKHPTFKPLPRPPRLNGILMAKQIRYQSNQINAAANQSMYKLFVAEALQQARPAGSREDADEVDI